MYKEEIPDEIFDFLESRAEEPETNEAYYRKAGMELARAYVPFQQFCAETLYSPEESLKKGTIFPELFRPYEAKRKKRVEGGLSWKETLC